MAYRLKLQSSLGKDLKRILLAQIERAHDELSGETVSPKNIHEARKCLKRLRSLLRLIAKGLPAKTAKREIARFRDIAAMLAPLRDRQILVDTAGQLHAHAQDDAHRAAITRLKTFLDSSDAIGTGTRDNLAAITNARTALEAALKPAKKLKLKRIGRELLIDGFVGMYRTGRSAGRHATKHPDDESYHDVRKAAQHHSRHLQLLMSLWPDLFEVKITSARQLAETLGDDHDLSILVSFVSNQPNALLTQADKALVIAAARMRQNELRAISDHQHRTAYAMRPQDYKRYVAALWATRAGRGRKKANGAANLTARQPVALAPPACTVPH
jgi:CHAD domain-containing protein